MALFLSSLFLLPLSVALASSAPVTSSQDALQLLLESEDCTENILDCLGGPPGPQGPQGPVGPAGPIGPPGPTGSVYNFRSQVRKIVKKYLGEKNLLAKNGKAEEEEEEEEEEDVATVIPFTGFKVAGTTVRVESPFVKFLPNGFDLTNFLDDEDQGLFNEGGHFDLTTGRFVAPENGTYHFDLVEQLTSLQLTTPSVPISTHLCVNHKCGLKSALYHSSWAATAPFTQTLSGLLRLKRGDYVSVIIFNLTEAAVQVNSIVLSGYRVA